FIEELTRKHIPISVQQRPAPLFVKSLQSGDVLRVILQKVRVVLNLSRNEGVLSTPVVFPNHVRLLTVDKQRLNPSVADVAGVAGRSHPRPGSGYRRTQTRVYQVVPLSIGEVRQLIEADEAVLCRLVLVNVRFSLAVPKLQHRTVIKVPAFLAGNVAAHFPRKLRQRPLDQRTVQLWERAPQNKTPDTGGLYHLHERFPKKRFGLTTSRSAAVQNDVGGAGVEKTLPGCRVVVVRDTEFFSPATRSYTHSHG